MDTVTASLSTDARAVIDAVLNAIHIPAARDADARAARHEVLTARTDLLVGCITYLRELTHAGKPVDLDTVLARLDDALARYPAGPTPPTTTRKASPGDRYR
ncbi:hypothetical protein ACQEU3_47190 [Spirillospora sp. CA-253888]